MDFGPSVRGPTSSLQGGFFPRFLIVNLGFFVNPHAPYSSNMCKRRGLYRRGFMGYEYAAEVYRKIVSLIFLRSVS